MIVDESSGYRTPPLMQLVRAVRKVQRTAPLIRREPLLSILVQNVPSLKIPLLRVMRPHATVRTFRVKHQLRRPESDLLRVEAVNRVWEPTSLHIAADGNTLTVRYKISSDKDVYVLAGNVLVRDRGAILEGTEDERFGRTRLTVNKR